MPSPKEASEGAAGPVGSNSGVANQAASTSLLVDNSGSAPIPDVPPPSYEEATGISPSVPPPPPRPSRLSSSPLGTPGAQASASESPRRSSGKPSLPPRRAAPGSIPTGRQFPPTFNLYTDARLRSYTLGEHQMTPLYAVHIRPVWSASNPVVALHNGPNGEAPLLAGVDSAAMSDQMAVTLPPPLTYSGGSTAVRLELIFGWTHLYRFTMEVGTDRSNVHQESFEWRHSYGNAIAALGGARDGWKLVRLSNAPLAPGQPSRPRGYLTSDGREVVAVWSDAIMSMSKLLKFAFIGTGLTGLLGERWAVMAVTSALGVWEKERGTQNRR